jgi:AraC-like DNA-binding protein
MSLNEPLPRPSPLLPARDDLFLRLNESRDFLAHSFAAPVSLEDAARQACLSPFHYHRLFARTFGETPHAFLTRRRIEEARRLLIAGDLPVTEVCLAVGYASLGTFSIRFHHLVGSSPSAYRRAAHRFFRLSPLYPYRFIPTCFLLHHAAPWR